jgi:hypothetical protein
MSTTDGSDSPYNNASYLQSITAGSTLSLYNVKTGKRCIFTLTTSTSQTSSSVSTASQLNPTLYGSYVFKVRSISTDYGLTLTQGDSYVVTFTISSGTAGGAVASLATLAADLLPGSSNNVSLGSIYSTFRDIYIGPNSLYISSYKIGCDASGNLVLSNTATGEGAPPPFTFDFRANTTIIQNLPLLSSMASSLFWDTFIPLWSICFINLYIFYWLIYVLDFVSFINKSMDLFNFLQRNIRRNVFEQISQVLSEII